MLLHHWENHKLEAQCTGKDSEVNTNGILRSSEYSTLEREDIIGHLADSTRLLPSQLD